MPEITVFIPTFNCSSFIAECIESIQQQSFTGWQILLLDDCSTDDTFKIAQTFASKDNRIKVSQNEKNLGMMGNWNAGLQKIDTKYFLKLDGDDYLATSALQKAYDILESDKDIGLVCSLFYLVDRGSKITSEHKVNGIKEGRFSAIELVKKGIDIFSTGVSQQGVILMRKSIIDHFGVYKSDYWGDQEWWFRPGVEYFHYFIISPLYYYRKWELGDSGARTLYEQKKGFYNSRNAIFKHYLTHGKITTAEYQKFEKDIRFVWYQYLFYYNRQNKNFRRALKYIIRTFSLKPANAFNFYVAQRFSTNKQPFN